MRQAPFYLIDVFSPTPFKGNPVAVVLAPDEGDAEMLAVAAWTGMPETVFVTRPAHAGADYAVRIFSPTRELPFAGHPSIGTCHLLLELGLIKAREGWLLQECPSGLIEMRVKEDVCGASISFLVRAKTVIALERNDASALAAALGAAPTQAYVVDAGACWITARFDDAETIARLQPSQEGVRRLADRLGALGVNVFGPSPDPDATIEVRSFGPSIGVAEDAVCGGGNACVAATVAHQAGGVAGSATYVASQGRYVGREGRVCLVGPGLDDVLIVGGQAVTTASGTLRLPDAGSVRLCPKMSTP